MSKTRVVGLLLLGLAACTQNTVTSNTCSTDDDCALDETCVSGTCVQSGGTTAGTTTGGTGSTTGGTTTGGTGGTGTGSAYQANSVIFAAPQSVVADGNSACVITVQALDASGAVVANTAVAITISGSNNTFLEPVSGTTNSEGSFSTTLTSTTIESKTVTATVNNDFTLTVVVPFTAGPPDVGHSSFSASPSTGVAADNVTTATLTLVLHDAQGNLAVGESVDFTSNGTLDTITPRQTTTDSTGTATAQLTSKTAEHKVVTAHFGEAGATLTADVVFVAGAPNASMSSFDLSPNPALADGVSTTTVELFVADAFGNAGGNVPVTITASDSNRLTINPNSGFTSISGGFNATVVSLNANTITFTATFGTQQLTYDETFLTSPSPTTSTLVMNPTTAPSDGSTATTVTVTVRDGDGTALQGEQITLSSNGRGDAFSNTNLITNSSGVATATLTSTVAGMKVITATLQSYAINANMTFTPPVCADTLLLPTVPVLSCAGQNPNTALATDFNGDTFPDLVVVDANQVTVWLGDNHGVFALQSATNIGGDGSAYAWLGDIVGDANSDLVIANSNDTHISVLQGAGDGNFQTAVPFAAGNHPTGLAVVDISGDTHADIIVSNPNDDTLSVLLNNGSGAFAAPTTVSTLDTPLAVAAGNLNGDANQDIVVANNGNDSISVFWGKGDGTFATPLWLSSGGSQPTDVVVADVTGDSNQDIVVANANSNTVAVLAGNGNGLFAAPTTFAVGNLPTRVKAIDLNADGKKDLVVSNTVDSTLTILINTGGGNFATGVTAPAGGLPVGLAFADYDHNGHVDVAVANNGTSDARLLLGQSSGPLVTEARYATDLAPTGFFAADLNNDGYPDVLTANNGGNVTVRMNQGDGTLGVNVSYVAHLGPSAVAVTDFNNDGIPDAAVANSVSGDVSILLGFGNGGLQAPTQVPAGTNPVAVVAGQFTQDANHGDMAVLNHDDGTVMVFLGDGLGSFAAPATVNVGTNPTALFAGDLDGVHGTDLVALNSGSDDISVLLNDGNGIFTVAHTYSTVVGSDGHGCTVGALGSIGQGNPLRLMVSDASSQTAIYFVGAGDGSFQSGTAFGFTGEAPSAFAMVDLNSDGKGDLLYSVAGSSMVRFAPATTAMGRTLPTDAYGTGVGPNAVLTADFNADGRPDVATLNTLSDSISVLISNGCAP